MFTTPLEISTIILTEIAIDIEKYGWENLRYKSGRYWRFIAFLQLLPQSHCEPVALVQRHDINYDAYRQWSRALKQAIRLWNDVLCSTTGSQWSLRQVTVGNILVIQGSGWSWTKILPRDNIAIVCLGNATLRHGFDPTRVVMHELGHVLGLPDDYNGRCHGLMSGRSAGPQCTNVLPTPAEAYTVEQLLTRANN